MLPSGVHGAVGWLKFLPLFHVVGDLEQEKTVFFLNCHGGYVFLCLRTHIPDQEPSLNHTQYVPTLTRLDQMINLELELDQKGWLGWIWYWTYVEDLRVPLIALSIYTVPLCPILSLVFTNFILHWLHISLCPLLCSQCLNHLRVLIHHSIQPAETFLTLL